MNHIGDDLRIIWNADAKYKVISDVEQKDVQIGFPVPMWSWDYYEQDGLAGISLPAVWNFKTFIDNKEVLKPKLLAIGKERKQDQLAFVWKMNFIAQHQYVLKTSYEFGVDVSNISLEGIKYGDWAPWYLIENKEQVTYRERMMYFIDPIKSWKGVPGSMDIQVQFSKQIPILYAYPADQGLNPTCIDTEAFYFRYKNELPTANIDIFYPATNLSDEVKVAKLPKMTKKAQWERWLKNVGEKAAVSCDLIDEIRKNMEPDGLKVLNNFKCKSSCKDAL
jgi:hypothetical protein